MYSTLSRAPSRRSTKSQVSRGTRVVTVTLSSQLTLSADFRTRQFCVMYKVRKYMFILGSFKIKFHTSCRVPAEAEKERALLERKL